MNKKLITSITLTITFLIVQKTHSFSLSFLLEKQGQSKCQQLTWTKDFGRTQGDGWNTTLFNGSGDQSHGLMTEGSDRHQKGQVDEQLL